MAALRVREQGFTLVELMVAMTLSLSLLAGLMYSVLGDMRAYESTRGSQTLASKGRISMQLLRLYIQQAGYRDLTQIKNNTQLPASGAWIDGQKLRGFNALTAGTVTGLTAPKLRSDIISLRFFGAPQGIVSCNGTAVTSATAPNGYQISLFVNTADNLVCQDTTGVFVLNSGVEHLRLVYGITGNSYRYLNADAVADWSAVNRVKVSLLVAQAVTANRLVNGNTYDLFDRAISAANDTRFRNVVNETVLIRN